MPHGFQGGNDLDEEVAQKVMGWKHTKFVYIHSLAYDTAHHQHETEGAPILVPPGFVELVNQNFRFDVPQIPKYSQSLDEAMKVVHHLSPDDEEFELTLTKEVNEGFSGYNATLNGFHAQAESMPKAICLAALKSTKITTIYEELSKALNQSTKLTDQEIANEFEVATSTVARWRNGVARPAPRIAAIIIKFVREQK
jgi:DNA-binding transcriptional regulator YiaG